MSEMFEKVLTTDRWPNRAISPLPFDVNLEALPVVLVHPGWGKRPEMLEALLCDLTDEGFRAIGLDTRYGYADRGLTESFPPWKRMSVGETNPFFDNIDHEQNRYFYRRPTGLLQACVDLDITECHYVGHSDGGRIGLTAAQADRLPVRFRRMVIVNGVGTGQASGSAGMLQSNIQAIKQRRESEASTTQALMSFRDSAVHFITHPRRTKREADMIRGYDAWPAIASLVPQLDQLTIINARDDRLVNSANAETRSQEYPEVRFMLTEGSHSNIYEAAIRELIVAELVK